MRTHPFGQEYFQDDMPVRAAITLRGHAVRALYLASGALDVATETGDDELAAAVRRQWANGVARRTYITGGVGSHHQDEAFGDDFELPADRAYAETCAGIASVMLSWRLLLATGEDKYADLIERTLLNNVLASPRADGRAFYYANTLHQRTPARCLTRTAQPRAPNQGCALPGSRSPAARRMSRARWRASACTSRPPATTASSCTSTATTGYQERWPRGRSRCRCPAPIPPAARSR